VNMTYLTDCNLYCFFNVGFFYTVQLSHVRCFISFKYLNIWFIWHYCSQHQNSAVSEGNSTKYTPCKWNLLLLGHHVVIRLAWQSSHQSKVSNFHLHSRQYIGCTINSTRTPSLPSSVQSVLLSFNKPSQQTTGSPVAKTLTMHGEWVRFNVTLDTL